MKTSEDIFTLIKSLGKTEKTYFKKFASIHVLGEGNNYIRLFDFVDKMKSYDESIVLRHFKDEKFTRQISVAKNYLYNAILKSLKSYRKSPSRRDEVIEMLESVSILYEKRLFEQAKKILRKCRKVCTGYEFYSELLQILIWEIKIVVLEREYDEKTDRIINENYDQRRNILNIIDNMNEYDRLDYVMVSQLTQRHESSEKTKVKNLERIISSSLLTDERKALSTTAKLKFNHIYAAYYYDRGELLSSYSFLRKEIEIIRSKKEMSEQRLRDFMILQTNMLLLAIELKKFTEFEENLLLLREYIEKPEAARNEELKFYIIQRSYLLELIYLKTIGRFSRMLDVNSVFEGKLALIGKKLSMADENDRINLISHAHFGLGDFPNALNFLNRILNDPESAMRYGDYNFSLIYQLLVHFELGNIDLLEYLIKSSYRYLVKNGELRRFERLIFEFLRKLPDAVSSRELVMKFADLKRSILKYSDDTSIKDASKYFDFISWLDSKIENKPFSDVVKLKQAPLTINPT